MAAKLSCARLPPLQVSGMAIFLALAYGLTGSSGAISNQAIYVLHFMNMSTDRIVPTNHSVYVSSFLDTKIRLDAPTIGLSDYATLDTTNNPDMTYFKYFTEDLALPRDDGVSRSAVKVVSDGTPIWVQVNQYEQGTTAAYLALPVTKHATEFFIPSYSNYGAFHSGLAVVGMDDGTCAEIYGVKGDEYTRLHLIHLDSLDVFTATNNAAGFDFTGYLVNGTKPMAVFGTHECAYIPSDKGFCDGIMEQVPPVIEWGTEFIVGPIAGRGSVAGYEFRIIASEQNTEVKYWRSGDVQRTVTVNRGQLFYSQVSSGPGNDSLLATVYITCSAKCLVVQYNKGAESDIDGNDGKKPDPFMMVVPPLDHYVTSTRFTTLDHYNAGEVVQFADYMTVVTKNISRDGLRLDDAPLTGQWTTVTGKDDYVFLTQQLTRGFHKLTHVNNDIFMAWIYGHGTADFTGYGYMAGYQITDDALDDVNQRYDVEMATTPATPATASPWVLGNWTEDFTQDDLPKFSVVFWGEFHIPERGSSYSLSQQVCSNGYMDFFTDRRLPGMASHLRSNIDTLCGKSSLGSVIRLETYPDWFYTEYTRGNLSFALTVTGSPTLTLREVASCALKLKAYIEDSRNWPTVADETQVNNRTFLLKLKEYVKDTNCDDVEMGPFNNRLYYNFLNAAGQSWLCNDQTAESYGASIMFSGAGLCADRMAVFHALLLTLLVCLMTFSNN